MRRIAPLKGHFKGRRRHRRRELPAFLRDNPKLLKKWQEVRAWKRGECPAPAGAPGARSLLKAHRKGRLYLPDVPALRGARFKCRVAKELAQVVMLACCKLHEGGAFIATRAELAELVGCSLRTVYNAMLELARFGWVVSFASFHQGGQGRDGRLLRYREGPRRYSPGPVMLAAWDANLAVVSLPKGERLASSRQSYGARVAGLSNEHGKRCNVHRKDPLLPEREVVLVTGGCIGGELRSPKESPAATTTEGREGGQQKTGQQDGRLQAPDREQSELDKQLAECCTVEEVNATWARFLAAVPAVAVAGGAT